MTWWSTDCSLFQRVVQSVPCLRVVQIVPYLRGLYRLFPVSEGCTDCSLSEGCMDCSLSQRVVQIVPYLRGLYRLFPISEGCTDCCLSQRVVQIVPCQRVVWIVPYLRGLYRLFPISEGCTDCSLSQRVVQIVPCLRGFNSYFLSQLLFPSGDHCSSSSAFPAVSLGFTILGEILRMWPFNPTIGVVTFCLHGWETSRYTVSVLVSTSMVSPDQGMIVGTTAFVYSSSALLSCEPPSTMTPYGRHDTGLWHIARRQGVQMWGYPLRRRLLLLVT